MSGTKSTRFKSMSTSFSFSLSPPKYHSHRVSTLSITSLTQLINFIITGSLDTSNKADKSWTVSTQATKPRRRVLQNTSNKKRTRNTLQATYIHPNCLMIFHQPFIRIQHVMHAIICKVNSASNPFTKCPNDLIEWMWQNLSQVLVMSDNVHCSNLATTHQSSGSSK